MKNNNSSKGSMIVLTIIGIATLLVAVIGATFAFFTASVKNKTAPSQIYTESGKMVIEFTSLNSIEYKGAIPGRPTWQEGETPTNRLRFKVTSDNTMSLPTTYDVYLKITQNEFANEQNKENLLFYLEEINKTRTSSTQQDNILGTMSDNIKKLNFQNFYETKVISMLDESEISVGGTEEQRQNITIGVIPNNTDPTNNSNCVSATETEPAYCMLQISKNARLGDMGSANEWYFEIWLNETGTEQNYDQGKKFKASIEIVTTGDEKLSNQPELITP